MNPTFLALVPPILAIIISLITKEVNLSLFIGIIVGALIFTSGNLFSAVETVFEIMGAKVQGNMGVLIFIIILGMIVHLMNLSGGSHQYAKWASKRIKTKKQSLFATVALGILIFVDDYFNCLTVGTVMRPITDRNHISREKLAYIIDSTAAPICMVAPISSWAAAVSSSLPENSGIDGFALFLKTIVCNYYTWFALAMIVLTTLLSFDFGKMRQYEVEANRALRDSAVSEEADHARKGNVGDLILPVAAIIVFSIIAMLYTGGYFAGGISVADAFADCDAIVGLAMGTLYALAFQAILYLPRKIVTIKEFLDGLVEGFRNMVPASLILIFAWTLSGICSGDYLNAGGYVAQVVETYHVSLTFMPAIFFLVSLGLAFSTGTSWGTFGILLPITVSIFGDRVDSLMVMTTAAVLGGSVCGDHISPISDTTILSSTGAECNHINHVESQIQYGLVVAGATFLSYIIGGLLNSKIAGLVIGIVLLTMFCIIGKAMQEKQRVF